MKNKLLYIGLLAILGINNSTLSQERKLEKANKEYHNYAYVDAIKTYERIANKGYKSEEMLKKIANSYYFKADLESASKWYGDLFNLATEIEPEYYYRYAQCLKSVKDYKKADAVLAKFRNMNLSDTRVKLAVSQKDYLEVIKKNSGRYTIENAGINSANSDYGSSYFGDKLIFTSARKTTGATNRKHTWTNENFTNLYFSTIDSEGLLSAPENFSTNLNSKFHESTPIFTKDGKTVYFTRNNYLSEKRGESTDEVTLLKLYKATLNDEKWTNITELPFNSDNYSVAHPALSLDEKTLYFASDMPGTLGQSDIFKTTINNDGSYGTPQNLGATINTEGRETFPFIANDNMLYFASDGHPGLGGLDIFVTKIEAENNIRNVYNIGEPVNSPNDDFAFIIKSDSKKGFLTSNRADGIGNDDIYKILEIKPLETICEQKIQGILTDVVTGEALANVKITLLDKNLNVIREVVSDKDGKYDFGVVACGEKYFVKSDLPEYAVQEKPIITKDKTGITVIPFVLEPKVKKIAVGDDLAKVFGIKIIHFNLDKSNILQDAAIELAKILDVMNQNPTMEIDVRSHTDCRQTAKYNQALSDRRAKSTIAWLVKKGIDANRLKGKGYGESQLLNNCGCEPTNQSNCTEEEHQANRRSEFIITKI